MEFFFADPNVVRLPPEKIRFVDLHAEPYPDGNRVRVTLELTPFLQRPSIELDLKDSDGREISTASIIEPVGWKLELTLHIRAADPPTGPVSLTAVVHYPEPGEVDRRVITFETSIPKE